MEGDLYPLTFEQKQIFLFIQLGSFIFLCLLRKWLGPVQI
jgi:hypothetical protein